MKVYKNREEVPDKYKWDLKEYFKNDLEFNNTFKEAEEKIKELLKYPGCTKSANKLLKFLKLDEETSILVENLYVYAYLVNDQELGNSKSMSKLLKSSGKKKLMKKGHTSSSVSNQRKTINEMNNKKINKHLNFLNNKNIKLQNKTYDEDDLKKILSIESTIQNDLDIHNDPLLVFDFIPKGNLINENILNDNKLMYLHNINFIPFAEKHLIFILKYLTINDYMNILMVNKICKKIVNKEILSNLEIEKKEFENKISSFDQEEIIEKIDMSKLVLTKASLKAINLLNETLLNKLFTESQVPSDDILLIYQIYFQLINHNIIKKNLKKDIFWKKCCEYFSNK